MYTLGELVAEILTGILDLTMIMLTDVLTTDPLSAISLLIGGLLTGVASVILGVLALGAFLDAIKQAVA